MIKLNIKVNFKNFLNILKIKKLKNKNIDCNLNLK